MNSYILISIRTTAVVIISLLFISGCSSSSDTQVSGGSDTASLDELSGNNFETNSGENASGADANAEANVMEDGSEVETTADNSNNNPDNILGNTPGNSQDSTPGNTPENISDSDASEAGPVIPNPGTITSAVPDPLVQNTTEVYFDIEVPAYQSDALQVRVAWGEKRLNAAWVGDEFWSVTVDFPTETQNLLVVTFKDGNGETTLGSFEATFETGTNSAESYKITAGQFDTDKWDTDGDGVSNLDELLAGNTVSASKRVLLFSETRDFRHSSTEVALAALEDIAASGGIETARAADSAGLFTEANLANYDAIVWVMTSGDVLDAEEQVVFEQYIRAGGGYVGIHAASFTEYEWPWYGSLVGAYFESHPAVQSATQLVENRIHLSTVHLSSTWTRTDEWYDYRSNPRAEVNVLLSLDESSYTGGAMGEDHPSAWYHGYDGGRSWYTGGGHTEESYAEVDFRAHLLGGLRYAAGSVSLNDQ